MPDSDIPDSSLMLRVAAGDEEALRLLIERWKGPLLSFTYRYLQNRESAQDITQDTFVRLYKARERYQPERPFGPWIFQIAANLCRNQQRWWKRHPAEPLRFETDDGRPVEVPSALQETENPAVLSEANDNARTVAQAVRALPHPQRVAVLLHYYEDLSYREIAGILNCSERGVETRLYRARKRLGELCRRPQEMPPMPETIALSLRLPHPPN